MRRVLIGTPAYDFTCDIRYINSLLWTVKRAAQSSIDLHWLFPPGHALVQQARNELVAAAVSGDFDDLIFIDADQGWVPEWIPTLLAYPVDCVGGPVRKKTDAEILFNVKVRSGALSITQAKEGLLTAPDMAVGTGFLRLSRKALRVLWDNSEKYTAPDGREMRWVFDVRPVDGELVGEDTHLCNKLRQFGIPTWIDPQMVPDHYEGTKTYTANFVSFLNVLRERAARAMHDYANAT